MVTASIPRPLAAAIGVLVDGVVGEPPSRFHPVRLFGRCMQQLETAAYRDNRAAGVAHVAVGTALGAAAGTLVGSTATATYVAVAGRELRSIASSIGDALEASDIEGARALLPSMVGRDVTRMDGSGMARAVVESVAENTVDAVVAPAWWAAVAGAPGVLAYRAVNTMDAMVGYRDERYLHYGWASARLDDVAAFVPARVTALLVAVVRPGAASAVWRAVQTQAPSHPSPNAGVAEAAFAAALDLRLGGINRYGARTEHRAPLGTGRDARPADIGRAVQLSRDVTWALGLVLGAIGICITARRGATGTAQSPGADSTPGTRSGCASGVASGR
jgi:adenosylcobinamide-phosphate synthase